MDIHLLPSPKLHRPEHGNEQCFCDCEQTTSTTQQHRDGQTTLNALIEAKTSAPFNVRHEPIHSFSFCLCTALSNLKVALTTTLILSNDFDGPQMSRFD
jgi:hypothetical protein